MKYWPKNEKFQLGTEVSTTEDAGSDDWSGVGNRIWGARGIITDRSDAHGLCYEVCHGINHRAWYEPEELEIEAAACPVEVICRKDWEDTDDMIASGWDGDGWYFWDEIQTHCHGPFSTYEEVWDAYFKYVEEML